MGHEQVRKALKETYPYKRWAQKVDRMSDDQVIAVYFKLFVENKIRRTDESQRDQNRDNK